MSAKKCHRQPRGGKGQHPQQGTGKKRSKTPEKRDGNVMIEENPNGTVADLNVKEKIMNAKLSMADGGKKPKSSSAVPSRAKSPEGPGGRGKRASTTVVSQNVEESQSTKKVRTRSQTEESFLRLRDESSLHL